MSKKETHNIHLSKDEILRYLDAKSTEEEMHKIERHLLHCTFCQEAVEGLESVDSVSKIESDLSQLEARLQERVNESKKKAFPIWRIAAIGIVLIISGYFINIYLLESSKNIQLTENKEKVKEGKKEVEKVKEVEEVEGEKEVEEMKEVKEVEGKKEVKEVSGNKAQIVENTNNQVNNTMAAPAAKQAATFDATIMEEEDVEYSDVIVSEDFYPEEEVISHAEEPMIERDMATSEPESSTISSMEVQKAAGYASTQSRKSKQAKSSNSDLRMDTSSSIYGIVRDEKSNETLPYVIIENKDKEIATTSDMDGKFELEAEKGDEIVVSYIGYEDEVIEIADQEELNVSMNAGIELEEIVITEGKKQRQNQSAKPLMGSSGYAQYLKENLRFPSEAQEAGIKGKVVLEFIIDKEGYAKDFSVVKSLGYGCDEEAIRLVREGPIWTPAMENGKVIEDLVKLKISFK